MSETKSTPGPWSWEYHPRNHGVVIALTHEKSDVLLCTGDDTHSWGLVSEADAQLISAAPDLLEACQLALSVGEALDHPDDENQRIYLGKSTVDVLRAAILKATGGQQ